MRGLQPVRGRLPGGGLHHHGGAAQGPRRPAHGHPVGDYANWTTHPNNPSRKIAAE
jgi:hypothetical protein